jgi:hypothetical protein
MFAFAQAGEPSIGVAALPQDLSPWGMFQHADIINKDDRIFLRADRSVPYGDVMINEIRPRSITRSWLGSCGCLNSMGRLLF